MNIRSDRFIFFKKSFPSTLKEKTEEVAITTKNFLVNFFFFEFALKIGL